MQFLCSTAAKQALIMQLFALHLAACAVELTFAIACSRKCNLRCTHTSMHTLGYQQEAPMLMYGWCCQHHWHLRERHDSPYAPLIFLFVESYPANGAPTWLLRRLSMSAWLFSS